jgi:hypothetical protein
MTAAAPAVSAGSQFKSVTETNEFQLHLPFGEGEPPQPYCEAQVLWPLTEADFRLFDAQARAGNAFAQNNLGMGARSDDFRFWCLTADLFRCGVFVWLV